VEYQPRNIANILQMSKRKIGKIFRPPPRASLTVLHLSGFWELRTLVFCIIITLNFHHDIKVTQPVTSLGCFSRGKMAANFIEKFTA